MSAFIVVTELCAMKSIVVRVNVFMTSVVLNTHPGNRRTNT